MKMQVRKVMLMMIMVGAVMQLQVPVVQGRHLITTSSTAAAAAPPAPVWTSRSSSEGGGPVTYIVGDSFGWTVPSGATTYSTWASDKTFNVRDILVFNFANQAHTVAEVTKTAFDSCSSETTTATSTISPARITLTHPGPHYFICTVPQHCSLGQKLAINVTRGSASSSDTPPPPPSPSINATPPSTPTTPSADGVIVNAPPIVPSSAPPSLMAALPVALLSIALAFFC